MRWAALAALAAAEQLRAETLLLLRANPSWAVRSGQRCARTNDTAEFRAVFQYSVPGAAEGECAFPGGEPFTAKGGTEGPEPGASFKYLRSAATPRGYAVVYETLTDLQHQTGDSRTLRDMCDRDAACTGYTVQCTGCEGCAGGRASCLARRGDGAACCSGEAYGMLLFGAPPTRTQALPGPDAATRAGLCFRKGAEKPRPDLGAYLRLHHQNCSGFFHAHPQLPGAPPSRSASQVGAPARCGPNRDEPCRYAMLPSKCGVAGNEPCSCQEACERNIGASPECAAHTEDRCEVATQDAAGWCHFWTRAGCQIVTGDAKEWMWVRPD